jgi:hypothetical protein
VRGYGLPDSPTRAEWPFGPSAGSLERVSTVGASRYGSDACPRSPRQCRSRDAPSLPHNRTASCEQTTSPLASTRSVNDSRKPKRAGATKVGPPQSERASRKIRPEKVPGQVRHAGHMTLGSDAVALPTRVPQNAQLFRRRAASPTAGHGPRRSTSAAAGQRRIGSISNTAQPWMVARGRTARTCLICGVRVAEGSRGPRPSTVAGDVNRERVASWTGRAGTMREPPCMARSQCSTRSYRLRLMLQMGRGSATAHVVARP